MPSSDELERSQRSHSTAALATSFSPLLSSESATVDVALAEVGARPAAQPQSVSASPQEDQSSLPSLTVAATGPRPPGSLAQQGRSKSMTTFTPSSRTHYSSRGFEVDLFEHAGEHVVTTTTMTTMTIDSSDTSMYRSLSSFSSGALAAHEQGNWLERLGKRATTFGRWTTEHDHTLGEAGSREMGAPHDGEGTRRSPLQRPHGNDEDGDNSPDEGDGRQGLHISTSAANRYRPRGPTRNKSSLSVFHDPFENCEDHTLDFDYTSSRPASPILSKPRSRPSSTPTSPRSRLELLPPLSKGMTRAQAEHEAELLGIDLDDPNVLAHQVLSAQDQLGVFSLVESVLEWPWSSSFDSKRLTQHKNRSNHSSSFVDPRTSEPSTPPTPKSLPISRVTSHHSLSHLFDDHLSHQQNLPPSYASTSTANASKVGSLNSARMTPLGNHTDLSHLEPIDVLNEGAWSETGELTAYYRAKSSGNLEGLRWELEDPRLERYELGKRLEKKVSGVGARLGGSVDVEAVTEAEAEAGNRNLKGGMGGESESEGEGERTRTGIREGLGVLLDTIGLGSFV